MPHFLVCACGHRWQWEAPDDAISSGIRDKVPAQTTEAEGQTITMNGGTPSAGPDDSTGIINPASLDLPEPPAEKDAGTVPTEPEKPVAPPPATAEMEPAASTEKIPPPVPSCPEGEEKWVKNQSAEPDDDSAATVLLGEALPPSEDEDTIHLKHPPAEEEIRLPNLSAGETSAPPGGAGETPALRIPAEPVDAGDSGLVFEDEPGSSIILAQPPASAPLPPAPTVEFWTRTISEESRQPPGLPEFSEARAGEPLRMCGWCKRAFVGNTWFEVEEAIAQLRLFHRLIPPSITHGICERCYQEMITTLANA